MKHTVSWWERGAVVDLEDGPIVLTAGGQFMSHVKFELTRDEAEKLGCDLANGAGVHPISQELADTKAALYASCNAGRRLSNELENLRVTTAEDQRVIDTNSELIMFLSRDVAQRTNERDAALSARDAWKETAEENDAATAPLRWDLRAVKRERDEAKRSLDRTAWVVESRDYWEAEALRYQALLFGGDVEGSDDIDELRATIVRQATEITALKGESE